MPTHYGGRTYQTFAGLVRAVKKDRPGWSLDRIRRYAGKIHNDQARRRRARRTTNLP